MNSILKSWKTTLLGLATLGYAVKVFVTTGNLAEAYTAVVAGIGLIFAKDADQTGTK